MRADTGQCVQYFTSHAVYLGVHYTLYKVVNIYFYFRVRMVLEFYYDLASQPSRALYIFMKANNVKYEARVTDLFKGITLRTIVHLVYR